MRASARAWRAPTLPARLAVALAVALAVTTGGAAVAAPDPAASLDTPLTATPGDAARGRAIVASRQQGLCLLCHQAPIAEERFQGDVAGNLAGAGSRWTAGQLRQRIVDSRPLNPDSVMPAFHRSTGLQRVAPAWAGQPLLSAQQVEDVVAWLQTLKDPPP